MRKVDIFDTTLRDGEQALGLGAGALGKVDKYTIASLMDEAGFDVIEAGFPASTDGDFESVRYIAGQMANSAVAGLARTIPDDIKKAYDAVKNAKRPRIHTFIAVSPIHMKEKLRMTPDQVYQAAIDSVKQARSFLGKKGTVEFSGEDSFRANLEFLVRVYSGVIKAGADVINVPDTVGYAQPTEIFDKIRYLLQNVQGSYRVQWSIHCHEDLGNATSNSNAAIRAGINQVEGTINGVGERAGNVALEEVLGNIKTRPDFFDVYTGIDTTKIWYISQQVSRILGMPVQPNKAIVGENAFAHGAGIHQDGVLKDKRTYEILKPEDWGWRGENILITPRSGRRGINKILEDLGYRVTPEELNGVYEKAMPLLDKLKKLSPSDLAVILEDEVRRTPEIVRLEYMSVTAGTNPVKSAVVQVRRNGVVIPSVSIGDGPIDALYKAINNALGIEVELPGYGIKTIGEGMAAQGEVTATIKDNSHRFIGRGVSTDIIEASGKAYISAVNKMLYQREKR